MNADLIERLREFAKATCETVTAENGEQLTYEDSIIWLAADALAAKDTALSEMRAELERVAERLSAWELQAQVEAKMRMKAEAKSARAQKVNEALMAATDAARRSIVSGFATVEAIHVIDAARALASQDEGEER